MVGKECARIIAFAGAGGKTTSIYAYAEKMRALGKRVIITTTTHMQYPSGGFLPLCETAEQAEKILAQPGKNGLKDSGNVASGSLAVCGTDGGFSASGTHKIASLLPSEFEKCRMLCDILLVEADGAKHLPLKVPAAHEPVIPPGCDVLIVCAGLDSLNKPLETVCFRLEDVKKILNSCYLQLPDGSAIQQIDDFHIITEFDIASLLFYGYILPQWKACSSKKICVLLNKKDVLPSLAPAQKVADYLDGWCIPLQKECPEVLWGGVKIESVLEKAGNAAGQS